MLKNFLTQLIGTSIRLVEIFSGKKKNLTIARAYLWSLRIKFVNPKNRRVLDLERCKLSIVHFKAN